MQAAARLFAAQYGVVADRQLRAVGIDLRRQNTVLRQGVWRRTHPGVIALAGTAGSWRQQAKAATLAITGSMLTGRSAARLHGCDGFGAFDGIELVAPRTAHLRRLHGVTARRSVHISLTDRHVIDTIPVTTLPVTLVHLAAGGHDAAKALDGVLRDGFNISWLRTNFERWVAHRPAPSRQMLVLLDERVSERLPRSWFQRIAHHIFATAGIRLEHEWPLFDASGRHLGDLDLAAVAKRVGVECQSWEWHGSPAAQHRDAIRKRRISALGWTVVEVWYRDLADPASVIAHLQSVLAQK